MVATRPTADVSRHPSRDNEPHGNDVAKVMVLAKAGTQILVKGDSQVLSKKGNVHLVKGSWSCTCVVRLSMARQEGVTGEGYTRNPESNGKVLDVAHQCNLFVSACLYT